MTGSLAALITTRGGGSASPQPRGFPLEDIAVAIWVNTLVGLGHKVEFVTEKRFHRVRPCSDSAFNVLLERHVLFLALEQRRRIRFAKMIGLYVMCVVHIFLRLVRVGWITYRLQRQGGADRRW
jgi:hypothetical protein